MHLIYQPMLNIGGQDAVAKTAEHALTGGLSKQYASMGVNSVDRQVRKDIAHEGARPTQGPPGTNAAYQAINRAEGSDRKLG
ncbi:MAG: hypothetical protein QM650_04400 [Microlunatus sp.]